MRRAFLIAGSIIFLLAHANLQAEEGLSTKEIAENLHLSVKTIETHRMHIMEKVNVTSVAALTKYAIREGITALE